VRRGRSETRRVVASADRKLGARIVRSSTLLYEGGADPALDRPAHVRAGSGLARVGRHIAVIQDDANFVALVDPATALARAVPLPEGPGGQRQFGDDRGNKHLKLDLEACVTVPTADGELLIAFGSGSSPRREHVAVLSALEGETPRVALHHVPALYAALRDARAFAGSEMNIEGAVYADGVIRLFQRGNGASRDGGHPVNATCALDWAALRTHLGDARADPPRPHDVVQFELGTLDGLPLGFTDAAFSNDVVFFSAAAEDSPDVTRDGVVAGSILGVVDQTGGTRWARLHDHDGGPFRGKVEGVLVDPVARDRLSVVVDQDDPGAPSELCDVMLTGPWWAADGWRGAADERG
jgi:hypothetical protein